MKSFIVTGASVKLFINNVQYKVAQTVSFDVDYNEEPIYGIDSPWPQEIAGNRVVIKGSVKGLRMKSSGGLQTNSLRPGFADLAASEYINIRITDRSTGEDIALINNAKITRESHSVSIKGTYKLSFDFVGQQILFPGDR